MKIRYKSKLRKCKQAFRQTKAKLGRINAPADMTVGSPWKGILAFTLPMLLGNIAQQLYNTVDSIVVGQYVGDNALAAVGPAAPS